MILPQEMKSQDLFAKIPSPGTNYVTVAKAASNGKQYVGVWGAGIFTTVNSGADWTENNSGLTNFYINAIEFGRTNELYVGTIGGIFKSTDNGATWNPANNGLEHLHVKAIKTVANGNVFVGTYGGGVYVSKDYGASWTQTGEGLMYRDITSLETTTQNYIVAGTYGGGIYVSRDGGDTWMRQNSGLTNHFINDLKRSPLGYVFAATNGRGVMESVNGGLTWAELDTFMKRSLFPEKEPLPDFNATTITFNKNGKVVYGTRYGGVFVHDDVVNFSWVPASTTRGNGVTSVIKGANDNLFAFFSSRNPNYSLGNGDVFEDDARIYPHPAPTSRIFYAKNDRMFKIMEDGEVWQTLDYGDSWSMISNIGQKVNDFAMDSLGNFLAGTDSGLYVSDQSATAWSRIKFADTTVYAVQVSPDNHFYLGAYHIYEPSPPGTPVETKLVVVTVNNGNDWINITPNLLPSHEAPKKIAITKNKTVYVSVGKMAFYTTDGGTKWTGTNALGASIKDMFPSPDGYVYIATWDGLYQSSTASQFTKLNTGLTYADKVFADQNGKVFVSGVYMLPANFSLSSTIATSDDKGATFKFIRGDYHSEIITAYAINEDNTFFMGGESGMIYRAIDPEILTAPEIISPVHNSFDIENGLELLWKSVEMSELYQVHVSIDDEYFFNFESMTLSDTSHIMQADFTYNTKYYWRVRAKNHSVVSPWSSTYEFTTKIAPPVLVSPVDDSVGVAVSTELDWEEVWGADKYEVQLSTTEDFSVIFFTNDNVVDTKIATPKLDGLTKYFWRVRAVNDNSTSYWSEVWAFTTVLGPPRFITPAQLSVGNSIDLEFTWSPALEATSYNLKISTNPDVSSPFYDESGIIGTSHTVMGLSYNTRYYAILSSSNEFGISEWSDVREFLTAYAPVVLTSPPNMAVNQLISPELQWTQFGGPELYHVQVAKNPDFIEKAIDDSVSDAVKYTVALEPFTSYNWRVRVEDDDNFGTWSEVWTLKTRLQAVSLRIPADESKNLPSSVQFLWFSMNNAIRYHLQIANDREFNDLIFSQDTISTVSHTFPTLAPNSTFYWRVRAYSVDGPGEWSVVWKFETGIGGPILIAPANNAEYVPLETTFSWELYNGALTYEFLLATDDKFTQVIEDEPTVTTTTQLVSGLSENTQYFWKVRADLGNGKSDWSQVWFFNTGPANSVNEYIANVGSYPNPFTQAVTIEFEAKSFTRVQLQITDASGRKVYDKDLAYVVPGQVRTVWEPKSLPTGAYYYRIIVGDSSISGELMLVK
jgi:photosystem II stability/assembly factor-like uncharacterized protein